MLWVFISVSRIFLLYIQLFENWTIHFWKKKFAIVFRRSLLIFASINIIYSLVLNAGYLIKNESTTFSVEKNVEQNIIDPDDFVRWIFPKLLDYRKNKYEKIASEYGYTVSASDVSNIDNENEFLELIENAIGS